MGTISALKSSIRKKDERIGLSLGNEWPVTLFFDWQRQVEDRSEIQYTLAYCILNKLGVSEDFEAAAYHLKTAAQENHVMAEIMIGVCKMQGVGFDKDPKAAFEIFTKYANTEPPNLDAMAQLGYCYLYGYGTAKNYDRAVEYLKPVAEEGLAAAQNNLAWCYKKGLGVASDIKAAAELYRAAADQDIASAANEYAHCLMEGLGVEKDPKEALEYYRKAAELGSADAENNNKRK